MQNADPSCGASQAPQSSKFPPPLPANIKEDICLRGSSAMRNPEIEVVSARAILRGEIGSTASGLCPVFREIQSWSLR